MELADLEENPFENIGQSEKSVGSHGEDLVPEPLDLLLPFEVIANRLMVAILPPEILFPVVVSEQDYAPARMISPPSEVGCIDDEMDLPRRVSFLRDDDSVEICLNRFPIVSGLFRELSESLLSEYVVVPEIIVPLPPFGSPAVPALITAVGLESVLDASLLRFLTSATRTKSFL